MYDLLVKDCLIVNGGQMPFKGSVAVYKDKIAAILEPDSKAAAETIIDGSGQVLFPGIIDPHVHFHYSYNYRDNSQDYDLETLSALLGGVTTAIRMHRGFSKLEEHLPPEIDMINRESRIDMALHLTLMSEDDLSDFQDVCTKHRLNSFKLYMAYKGNAGKLQGIAGSDDGYLFEAMRRISEYPGGVACIHAENSDIIERYAKILKSQNRDDIFAWTEARPGWTEAEAIFRAGTIAQHTNCPLYVVHITSGEGIEAIKMLRQNSVKVFAEVCIQHLTQTVDTELGKIAKVNPPLRYKEDVEALWRAVEEGVVDTIATDHVAHTREKASVSLWDVMPGNPGTATMLPALLHYGYHRGRISLSDVASLLSKRASEIFHLDGKGNILPGYDADLALVDLNLERKVSAEWLRSTSDYSLYEGTTLIGWPTKVVLRGQVAMDNSQVLVPPGYGKFIERLDPVY